MRRSWAPRGHTPVLVHQAHWKNVSVCGLLCYRPDGRARLSVHYVRGSYNTDRLIVVLRRLHTLLRGTPVILLWDNLSAHRSRPMREFLAAQRDWLTVHYLPSYAPELNPTENLWSSLKTRDLANRAATTLDELLVWARRGVERIRRRPDLLSNFLVHTGLALST